jgi:predicted acyl esterase
MPANPILATLARLTAPWHFVVGGGGHDGQDTPESLRRRAELVDAWLDHHILGHGPSPAPSRVTWTTRPGWDEDTAPTFAPASWETLYLRLGGQLETEPAPGPAANLNITHVPRDPDYDLARAIHHDLLGASEAWPREEVRFDAPPTHAPIELRGAPRFHLHLLPERPWLQVHAELWDVDPDGEATRITRGQFGTRAAIPGRHLAVTVEARAMAWRLAAGHHLRVVIADQDPAHVFPEFRPYRARLFVDDVRPSCVELPLA